MTASILIQTSKVLNLNIGSSKQENYLPICDLKWRQKNLWIKNIADQGSYKFPALTRKQWLENCLCNSWLKRVCIDPELGEKSIKLWADTCKRAGKPIFLRITSNNHLPSCRQTVYWRAKRICDWLISAIILLVISPLMLLVALSIKFNGSGPIFYCQWRVGTRGKLFKIYKFRTMTVDAELKHHEVMKAQEGLHKVENDPRVTFVGKWLRKYSLDELPQLINVLRGEMSLVGPRPWALYDALRLGKLGKQRLNALPGITGAWQVASRSNQLNLNDVTKCDLEYLYSWSLIQDLKILLMTVPKVISGFGAY
ncbi:UDP-phosphate galactose phosphotransferase [Pleurocapsa sp. CCALA 161]|uniref:heterocyst development glycosyltransferase HepC n=1 Tax=Pleurocapsa sp. CCALA 161 TaxID=2107688 RepID=UPI000D068647|nr:heterocyst development glycosyltransferase HepC [Pleurocapsa sp. CCALA 161]PSB09550.1 UDP-phosphate galactose phosphotransferase [Pleurocapsa sp. CCALA 161]